MLFVAKNVGNEKNITKKEQKQGIKKKEQTHNKRKINEDIFITLTKTTHIHNLSPTFACTHIHHISKGQTELENL